MLELCQDRLRRRDREESSDEYPGQQGDHVRRDRSSKQSTPARPKLERPDALGREIQAALEADIKSGARFRFGDSIQDGAQYDGYCAVASAAYFFIEGARLAGLDLDDSEIDWERAGQAARDAGLQPMQRTRKKTWRTKASSHWWIRRTRPGASRTVVDLTHGPSDEQGDYPYELGKERGFMQTGYTRPNKTRALPLIEVVLAARRPPPPA